MRKKLQVFISSTFEDMKSERLAAIDAVLRAGHIPTGMEQFNAGDEPQKETIKRWIDDADAYLLILGGRYGSVEPATGKSYTHWEYDYAAETGMPFFAIVLKDEVNEAKAKEQGIWLMEREYYQKYQEFKKTVLDKISKLVTDNKEIQLAITQKLAELEKQSNLTGWVPAKDIPDVAELEKRLALALRENEQLKLMMERVTERASKLPQPSAVAIDVKGNNLKYLSMLNKATNGTESTIVKLHNLAEHLGFPPEETKRVTSYLKGEGLLKFMTIGGGISITHEGVRMIDKITNSLPILAPVEWEIIMNLYDKMQNVNFGVPIVRQSNLDAKNCQELGHFLTLLQQKGMINFVRNPFLRGGQTNPKYGNNILSVSWEDISITDRGVEYVQTMDNLTVSFGDIGDY